jgi:hypothetical protein
MKLRLLLAGVVAFLFAGCAGDAVLYGPYAGPYYGGFGPYYPDYGPFYGGAFVIGGRNYPNYYGGHHFVGNTFASRHFAGGGVHAVGGGFHGGGGRPR